MLSDQQPRLQLAFITGQSDPSCCALSPLQTAFGQALLRSNRTLRHQNFPYSEDTPEHRPVSLWRASLQNTAQYLKSRQSNFVRTYQGAMENMLNASPHTLLLAGSCGLELLINLNLPQHMLQRISVLSYGPVARRIPTCANLLTVVGNSDWISRITYGKATRSVSCGHLNYLKQSELLVLAQQFATDVEAKLE